MDVFTALVPWAVAAAAFAGVSIAVAGANAASVAEKAPPRLQTQHALVIAAIGAVVAFIATRGHGPAWPEWPGCVLLLALLAYFAVFDLRFYAVPIWPLCAAIALGMAFGGATSDDLVVTRAAAATAGLVLFALLDWAYRAWRGRSGLGFGDAMMAALIGAWLSWQGLAWSVALGSGLGVAFVLMRGGPERPIAFAPALALGAACFLAQGPLP